VELSQIRETLKAKPFLPFTMRLVDGRECRVPHREFLYVPSNMRHTLVCCANEEAGAITILDSAMITDITFSKKSGKRRRRADSDEAGEG
jgi:hypothetical protein